MRKLPPLNALRVFEAAARYQNLSKAALELNVSRTAVSQQVKQLELYLNAQLFQRHGSRLQLTIRIAQSFCQQWLLPRLADFKCKHPNISIKMLTTNNIYPQKNANIDLEIINGYGDWTDFEAIKLTQESWLVVASPDFKAVKCLDTLNDLALADKISILGYDEKWQDWFALQEYTAETREPQLIFENSQLAIEAALNCLGILFVRSLLVDKELKDGRLVSLSEVKLPSRSHHYLICHKTNINKKSQTDFIEWLLQYFA